uniref:GYF domain-containing protein n=1 Tax=Chenopodium quinoa TaxID=63459 RepID=A0A803N1J5_CHEQI
MASSDSRNPITVTPPNQIAKDFPGPDNPIPLSPQWLLPKPGETKTGMSQGGNRPSPYPGYGDGSDVIKPPGHGEEMHDSQKKKDVFRPTFLDQESGRRDRWRDEERDTNPLGRRDRWREGEKEIGDGRKTDRWVDNPSSKNFGEARRAPADRWADPSRENNYDQRRESKWNTRWGPDDKEVDKWTDAGKHGDMPQDKGQSLTAASHGKDERDGDHHRPWRPSSLQNRAKAEPPHHQPQMTSKEGPTFGHGRGRGDNATFSVGRGRATFGAGSISNYSVHSHSSLFNSDRGDNGHEEPSPFSYNRTKLLDIYRLTEIKSSNKILDGLKQVSSLTQEEPLEPLALCAPTSEESVIMKGIDRGEIVSSGAPQNSKDGSAGRSSNDFAQSRRIKHGSRDDVSLPPDEAHDKGTYGSNVTMDGSESHQISSSRCIFLCLKAAARDDDSSLKKGDEVTDNKDSGIKGRVYTQSGTPWRSPSLEEHANAHSRDWFNSPSGVRSRSSDISWTQAPKDSSNVLPDSSYAQNELKWQVGEDSAVRKHPAVTADREQETRKLLQPSPEDMLLYYKDPQGQVQGPFSGSDIIGWFEAGYFGIDLRVRPVNAPIDSAFFLLGDVMPHLRAKARPPPGFNTAKQNEVADVSSIPGLSGFGKPLPVPTGGDLLGNEHRLSRGTSTEAENKFLESLMAGDVSSSHMERFVSKGLPGFAGQTSTGMLPSGAESADALNLLAQRMNLERQKSLNQSYPYWPNRDGAPVVPSPDIVRNSSVPQANLHSTIGDIPQQSLPQNVEMMSILQGLSDRPSSGVNNGLGGWPNFSVQGGIDPFKDKIDLHHGQNFPQVPYGMQQHKLQPQNHPSMTNLLAQSLDNPAMVPDKLLSAGLTQDPQALNMLQQQYLLQLQSQQAVLSEQQLVQRFGDPAFGQLQTSASPIGNTPGDQSLAQLSPSMFQSNSQVPVSGVPDDRIISIANMPPKLSQDLGHQVPAEGSSLHLPHQMLGMPQNNWPSMSTHADSNKNHSLSSGSEMMENIASSEAMEKPLSAAAIEHSNSDLSAQSFSDQVVESDSKTAPLPTLAADPGVSLSTADFVPSELSESSASRSSVVPQGNEIKLTSASAPEENSVKESHEELSASKEVKNVEAREVKKTSDKKSRKLKSSKAQPSPDQGKGAFKVSNVQKSKQSEVEGALSANKSDLSVTAKGALDGRPMEMSREIENTAEIDLSTSPNHTGSAFESMEGKGEQKQSDSTTQRSAQVNSAQRAWKPAVSVKPKSLLEIQQEEQKRAQMEIPASTVSASVSSMSFSSPWGGVVTHVEPKVGKEIHPDSNISDMGKTELPKSKKSGLHDLLAAEVLAKSSNRSTVTDNSISLPPLPTISSQPDVVDDDNFIEAKDTKKSRKKAAKAKVAGGKVSASVSSADVAVASSPVEKVKSTKHIQAVKEVLPVPPSGPSLGDFVPWKGESTSPSPAPAWSSDSGKFSKPTSLRDILKEQGKKGAPAQQYAPTSTPPKLNTTQTRPGSWSVSASSPSKAASPVQVNSQLSTQSKYKGEDDLFWGPPDQSKQEAKQSVFPQLGNQGSLVAKSTPVKGTPAASISRQKSTVSRAVEHSISSSPVSSQVSGKGKRDGSTKHLEAMDFRNWCETESVRLTGSKDTSFLEFCLKQSRSEAETLLVENLGSFDPNHEFIEKFLNYMEMLSVDVLELAFQSRNDLKAYNNGARDMNSDYSRARDLNRDGVVSADGSTKGGKKKGKKGKKVSPAVLGFNVVSNRIMMGEIQTLED